MHFNHVELDYLQADVNLLTLCLIQLCSSILDPSLQKNVHFNVLRIIRTYCHLSVSWQTWLIFPERNRTGLYNLWTPSFTNLQFRPPPQQPVGWEVVMEITSSALKPPVHRSPYTPEINKLWWQLNLFDLETSYTQNSLALKQSASYAPQGELTEKMMAWQHGCTFGQMSVI